MKVLHVCLMTMWLHAVTFAFNAEIWSISKDWLWIWFDSTAVELCSSNRWCSSYSVLVPWILQKESLNKCPLANTRQPEHNYIWQYLQLWDSVMCPQYALTQRCSRHETSATAFNWHAQMESRYSIFFRLCVSSRRNVNVRSLGLMVFSSPGRGISPWRRCLWQTASECGPPWWTRWRRSQCPLPHPASRRSPTASSDYPEGWWDMRF